MDSEDAAMHVDEEEDGSTKIAELLLSGHDSTSHMLRPYARACLFDEAVRSDGTIGRGLSALLLAAGKERDGLLATSIPVEAATLKVIEQAGSVTVGGGSGAWAICRCGGGEEEEGLTYTSDRYQVNAQNDDDLQGCSRGGSRAVEVPLERSTRPFGRGKVWICSRVCLGCLRYTR